VSVVGIKDVQTWLGKELANLVNFEVATVPDKGQYVILRPKQFLDSGDFAKIAAVVRQHGGEYISRGKESHFRIPSVTETTPTTPLKEDKYYQAVQEIKKILGSLE